jgi:3-hydroxyisobutyrate dehydrogenase
VNFLVQFALSLALKDVHLALETARNDRFRALAYLANEWQGVVERRLGDRDLSIVTWALEEEGEER